MTLKCPGVTFNADFICLLNEKRYIKPLDTSLEIHKRDSNPLNIKTLSKYEYQLIYNYNTAVVDH